MISKEVEQQLGREILKKYLPESESCVVEDIDKILSGEDDLCEVSLYELAIFNKEKADKIYLDSAKLIENRIKNPFDAQFYCENNVFCYSCPFGNDINNDCELEEKYNRYSKETYAGKYEYLQEKRPFEWNEDECSFLHHEMLKAMKNGTFYAD